MKTYRVALLGCRGRGTAAGRAYYAHPRTDLVGLCDLIPERFNKLGDEFEVPPSARYTDLDKMIEEVQPDIVAIPTATELHYELSMRVLEHGVNIEVEKPMCIDLEQADAVIAKAESKGVKVAVHQQSRAGPNMQATFRAFQQGRIGRLRYITGSGKGYYGGYGLMNIGTHMLNNMLQFGERCRSVSAVALTDGRVITPEDVHTSPAGMGTITGESITAMLQFGDNVTGTLLQHRFPVVQLEAYSLELYGTEGRLLFNASGRETGGAWWMPTPHHLPDGTNNRWERLEPVYPDQYDPASSASPDDFGFADEYVRALDEDRDHACSGDEGRHIVEIMMGIFESAAYGRRVELPQPGRDHPLLRWRREHGLDDPPPPVSRAYSEWLVAEDQRLGRG